VTLGLCSQIDLDAEVKKAAAKLEREREGTAPAKGETLAPTEETIDAVPEPDVETPEVPEAPMATALAQQAREAMAAPEEEEDVPDADSVFAKLKELKRDLQDQD
jgi:uncharacterized protein